MRTLDERKKMLEAASREGSKSTLEHALKNKSVVRTPTTLATAAAKGDIELIKDHLDRGVDVNGEVDVRAGVEPRELRLSRGWAWTALAEPWLGREGPDLVMREAIES